MSDFKVVIRIRSSSDMNMSQIMEINVTMQWIPDNNTASKPLKHVISIPENCVRYDDVNFFEMSQVCLKKTRSQIAVWMIIPILDWEYGAHLIIRIALIWLFKFFVLMSTGLVDKNTIAPLWQHNNICHQVYITQ